MSQWQEVIQSLKVKLKGINGQPPYISNLNNRVYEWRAEPFAFSELPAVLISESSLTLDNLTLSTWSWHVGVDISCYTLNMPSARTLIQDVLTAIKSFFESQNAVWDLEIDSIDIGLTKKAETGVESVVKVVFKMLSAPWGI